MGEAPGLNPRQLYEAIVAQPGYVVDTVTTGIVEPGVSGVRVENFTIEESMTRGAIRADTHTLHDVVGQQLKGVVRSGNNFFGIVEGFVGSLDTSELLLTRFSKGGGRRASIVDIIPVYMPMFGGAMVIDRRGRRDDYTDRGAFTIGTLGGRILLRDTGRFEEPTELIRRRSDQVPETHVPKFESRSGLLGAIDRRATQRRPISIPPNPLDTHELWSAPSVDVKREVEWVNKPRYP
jgi:hypothetical protein